MTESTDDTDTKGPGGIINTPREFWPEGWTYVEGESSPPVNDIGRENLAWLAEQEQGVQK